MHLKYVDWRHIDKREDRNSLAFTYHLNSAQYPHLEVMTRSRMKMLRALFARMNQEITANKRYFSTECWPLHATEMSQYPIVQSLFSTLSEQHDNACLFYDYKLIQELGKVEELDTLHIYTLARSIKNEYALLHVNLEGERVEKVKRWEDCPWHDMWSIPLDEEPEAIVMFTCNIQRKVRLFGDRGYRLGLLEAGRWTEKLCSCAQSIG